MGIIYILDKAVWLYTVMIVVYCLVSWFPRLRYNPAIRPAIKLIDSLVEPYLNIFRRFMPPQGMGGLDLSPVIGIFVLKIGFHILVSILIRAGIF